MTTNPEDALFEVLAKLADHYGWELSKRDPGPVECDLDDGWCSTHNAWIDQHEWHNTALMSAPINDWTEDEIRNSTKIMEGLLSD